MSITSDRMLVRWRADPKKVRIKIIPHRGKYYVEVRAVDDNAGLGASASSDAVLAVNEAFESMSAKDSTEMLDLDCQRTYEHPWKRPDGSHIKAKWEE